MGKLDHVLEALADRRLENMDPNDPETWNLHGARSFENMDDETLKRNLQNGLKRPRKSNMQPVGLTVDIGGMVELLQEHQKEFKEEIAKRPGDDNKAVLHRIDQLFLSLVEWVKGMATSMSKLENSVARHTQAVANLKLPEIKLEKAEWEFTLKRNQGGFIKKVEAKQV